MQRGEITIAVQAHGKIDKTIDTTKLNNWYNDLDNLIYDIKTEIEPTNTSSTQSYTADGALPADYYNHDGVDMGFFLEGTKIFQTNPYITETGYYIEGDTVKFTGISNQTVVLRYTPMITDKTSYVSTDVLQLPNRYRELAEAYIKMRFFEDEEYVSFQIEAKSDFEEEKARYIDGFTKTPIKTSGLFNSTSIY